MRPLLGVTKRFTVTAMSVFGGFAVFSLTELFQAIQQQRDTIDVTPHVMNAIEWGRLIGGVVGLVVGVLGAIFGAFGIWVYYRTTVRTKTTEGLESTVKIYRAELEALHDRDKRMSEDYKQLVGAMAEREREIVSLRGRTDLSEVLKTTQSVVKVQNDLLELKRTHDAAIINTLADAVKAGDAKYAQVTDMLAAIMRAGDEREDKILGVFRAMLEQLGSHQVAALEQAKANHAAIGQLLKSVDALSRRFGEVEKTVDQVAATVDAAPTPQGQTHSGPERRSRPR